MSRVWFSTELETVATFWRLLRSDGVAQGFTTHDADLWFDGINHAASPGMLPSAIRKSSAFEEDSAEVEGALSHDAIDAADLVAGRYDGAVIRIGLVDWETLESHVLYAGTLGTVLQEEDRFTAQLVSRKAELARDTIPRTSPICRAAFCGPGCTIPASAVSTLAEVSSVDMHANAASFQPVPDALTYAGGEVRWLAGPQAGQRMRILGSDAAGALVLSEPMAPGIAMGTPAELRQGCDHTLATCADRFDNAVNFQGEPFLPGNDMLTRAPTPPG